MRVALLTDVFHDDPGGTRLDRVLAAARGQGADVAVLPELPLDGWAPASQRASDSDAEEPDGPRQETMARAAAQAGLALVGGVIVRDPRSGARYNTALVYHPDGTCLARYRKIHLPAEEGYWETSHYEPGADPPRAFDGLSLRAGLQICSDVNRPDGVQLLAAQGAEVVFAPRATPPETYERWKLVLRANAVTSGAYVVSVNRPRPERGASIGGPSLVVDPFGEVLAETTEPVHVVELRRSAVDEARRRYPGYLDRFPSVYARGWSALGD